MDVPRHDLLAGPGFAGDEHRGVRTRDLLGTADGGQHRRVPGDQSVALAGRRLQHGRDQLGIGWQGQEILRAVANRSHGRVWIVLGATGHHRYGDPLAQQALHQLGDRHAELAQHEVEVPVAAQLGQPAADVVRLIELRAPGGRDLRRLTQLAAERTDDQDAHAIDPCGWSGIGRMIRSPART